MKHQGEELSKVYVNIDLRDRKQFKSYHGLSMHVIGAKDQNKICVRFFLFFFIFFFFIFFLFIFFFLNSKTSDLFRKKKTTKNINHKRNLSNIFDSVHVLEV